MKPAIECVPDMHEGLILHAGPEISWERMCQAQQQGGINGALFEGYAKTEEEARRKLESGEIEFRSANDRCARFRHHDTVACGEHRGRPQYGKPGVLRPL